MTRGLTEVQQELSMLVVARAKMRAASRLGWGSITFEMGGGGHHHARMAPHGTPAWTAGPRKRSSQRTSLHSPRLHLCLTCGTAGSLRISRPAPY